MAEPWRRSPGVFAVMAAPPILFLLAFFVAPMAIVWAYSFGENKSLVEIAVDGALKNYARALHPLYLGVILKSLWFAVLSTAACLVLGFPVAVAIAFSSPRAKAWLLLLVVLPFWTNLLVRTYALIAVLRTEGLVNVGLHGLWDAASGAQRLLGGAGLSPFHPLGLLHNGAAVVVGLVYVQLPFMVLPLYAALDRMDRSLIEASLDLGAGRLETFRRIVIPLAAPGIVSGVIVTLIPSLGAYLTPDLLGGPRDMMIANIIERQFKTADNWPFGAALSFVLMYMTLAAVACRALAPSASPEPGA